MNLNLTTDEIQSFQNAYMVPSAPVMSHQTSQQTVTPQAPAFESASTIQYLPHFSVKEEEMETKLPVNMDNPGSYHVLSPFHSF